MQDKAPERRVRPRSSQRPAGPCRNLHELFPVRPGDDRSVPPDAGTPGILSGCILAVLAWFRHSDIAVHFLFAALVVSCVIRENHFLASVLRQRLIVHLGVISYGMYLMHGLVYDALGKIGPGAQEAVKALHEVREKADPVLRLHIDEALELIEKKAK